MAIPAHDSPRLQGFRVRYVMIFWWAVPILALIEAIFDIEII